LQLTQYSSTRSGQKGLLLQKAEARARTKKKPRKWGLYSFFTEGRQDMLITWKEAGAGKKLTSVKVAL